MKIIGFLDEKFHVFTDENSGTTYAGVYTERSDGDWDRIAVFGVDYRSQAYTYAEALERETGDEYLIIETDRDDFPDVYDGGTEGWAFEESEAIFKQTGEIIAPRDS